MRERTKRRQLVALGCPAAEPTQDMRETVRIMAFNRVPLERIAVAMEMREIEVAYWFSRELDLAEDYYVTLATKAMLELAAQRADLGVAFRANEMMLRTRSKPWRVPADEADQGKPVEMMSLIEVDTAIAALERRRRDSAAAADAEAPAPDVEDVTA